MSGQGHTIHFHSGATNITLDGLHSLKHNLATSAKSTLMTLGGSDLMTYSGFSTLTFSEAFDDIPNVIVTPMTTSTSKFGFVSISTITKEDFSVCAITNTGESATMKLNWIATNFYYNLPTEQRLLGSNITDDTGEKVVSFTKANWFNVTPTISLTTVFNDIPGQYNFGYLTVSTISKKGFRVQSYVSTAIGAVPSSLSFQWMAEGK